MRWDPAYTDAYNFKNSPCGPEAFSWVMQAAVHLGKIPPFSSLKFYVTGLGTGTAEMMKMFAPTRLGYETKEGLRFSDVDPHLAQGKPVMIILCDHYQWEDGDSGKLHWVVLTGFVSGDRDFYWFVSNGSVRGWMGAELAEKLVNNAIGNPFKKGAYIAHRVFLVDW
mmetsp:Transcript_4126/g.7566  ORF Transcript_4126/g.7566 Transcript_4126/m.7566 type:complete len:167 (-) Transcript_4126:137-637(-)